PSPSCGRPVLLRRSAGPDRACAGGGAGRAAGRAQDRADAGVPHRVRRLPDPLRDGLHHAQRPGPARRPLRGQPLPTALAGRRRPRAGRAAAAPAATATMLVSAVPCPPPMVHQRTLSFFFLSCAIAAAIALGVAGRAREAQLVALADRAARLEVEREQRSRLA